MYTDSPKTPPTAGDLLRLTPAGLYCPEADVYLDPWRPVPKAVITHAHSDHARPGMGAYLSTPETALVLKHRLGAGISVEERAFAEAFTIRGVHFSLHPAGHVPGSAQVRVEHQGEVWVFSGDYKVEDDGLSAPFEPVRCHTFISECTFGLPIFSWRPQAFVFSELASWISQTITKGIHPVLLVYALGKAQRVLAHLPPGAFPVCIHPTIQATCDAMRFSTSHLHVLPAIEKGTPHLILAPPSVLGSRYLSASPRTEIATASGWMAIRGMKRRRGIARGFVLSDHADFDGLVNAVKGTEASRALFTHGYTAPFSKFIASQGIRAQELASEFDGGSDESE